MSITEANTERTGLLEIAIDAAAHYWMKLKYPMRYESVRMVLGHQVRITIEDYSIGQNAIEELRTMNAERSADG